MSQEKPEIFADRFSALSPQEKEQLRAIITSPLWLKFLSIVACKKPSSVCFKAGSAVDRDAFSEGREVARLGELRGWEMYEVAIYLALQETKELKAPAQEGFPDAGRIDHQWDKAPPGTPEPTLPEPQSRRRKK